MPCLIRRSISDDGMGIVSLSPSHYPSRLFPSSRIRRGHVAWKPPFMEPHQVIQQYGAPKAKGQRIAASHTDDFTGHASGLRRMSDRIRGLQRCRYDIPGLILAEEIGMLRERRGGLDL